jgi:hypothetical protein
MNGWVEGTKYYPWELRCLEVAPDPGVRTDLAQKSTWDRSQIKAPPSFRLEVEFQPERTPRINHPRGLEHARKTWIFGRYRLPPESRGSYVRRDSYTRARAHLPIDT